MRDEGNERARPLQEVYLSPSLARARARYSSRSLDCRAACWRTLVAASGFFARRVDVVELFLSPSSGPTVDVEFELPTRSRRSGAELRVEEGRAGAQPSLPVPHGDDVPATLARGSGDDPRWALNIGLSWTEDVNELDETTTAGRRETVTRSIEPSN